MHLVFLNQYYPPDAAPTGVMLEGLVAGLIESGHEVSVLCAAGGYAGSGGRVDGCQLSVGDDCEFKLKRGAQAPQTTDNGQPTTPQSRLHIHRIRAFRFGRGTFIGKLGDYASYYAGVAWKLMTLRPRPERIVAMTTPPYLSVLARLMSRLRGADHAHWVMDVYPDVLAAHGMLAEKGFIYRILSGLACWGFGGRRCAAVLTIGPDMAARVGRRVGKSGGKGVISDQLSVVGTEGEAKVPWVPLWGVENVISGQLSVISEEEGIGTPEHRNTETPRTDASLALRRQRGWGDDELVVMYSGNMGLGHRFAEILAAANILKEERVVRDGRADRPRTADMSPTGRDTDVPADSFRPPGDNHGAPGRHAGPTTANGQRATHPPPRIVFSGDGKRRGEIEMFIREHPGCGVELHDYAPAADLSEHLRSADVHLASLDAKWTGTMVPSKLQGIFAAGRPVIFIGSADSSIGGWVQESGGGWVVAPGDVGGVLAALAEARDPAVRSAMGRAAQAFASRHFDRATNIARIAAVLGMTR